MLKKLFLSICLMGFLGFSSYLSAQTGFQDQETGRQGGIQWYTDFNQAAEMAKQSQKPIILFFTGSDWCGWCKKISQEIFTSADFVNSVANKFIFVEVDFPMNKTQAPEQAQQNAHLKQKYNITGYPTVVILDPNLNVLEVGGYRPGGGKEYAKYLMQFGAGR